ncbi:unnamed protein product [Symbiodinium sp. CCMP2592]|nr:unnamed protein product [Symbiodinium sp. CCMP2592]
MGGKKWKEGEWRDDTAPWHQEHGRSYRLWPGSWHASPKARNDPPRYDQVVLQDGKGQEGRRQKEEETVLTETNPLLREVQKALSGARRADGKVRRLREDRCRKEKQWKVFQQQSKAAFVKEEKRYEAALEKIETEIAEATAAGQAASQMIHSLVNHGIPTKATEEVPARGSWEALLEQEEPPMEPGFLSDALRAAQQARMRCNSDGNHSSGAVAPQEAALKLLRDTLASLPPEIGASLGLGTVPGSSNTAGMVDGSGFGPGAPTLLAPAGPKEPYASSPSTTTMDAAIRATTSPSPQPKVKAGNRQPVKGAAIQPVHTSHPSMGLTGKLEAKRSALLPFGGGYKPESEVQIVITEPTTAAAAAHESQEDDADEEMGATRAPPAAGLDGMG